MSTGEGAKLLRGLVIEEAQRRMRFDSLTDGAVITSSQHSPERITEHMIAQVLLGDVDGWALALVASLDEPSKRSVVTAVSVSSSAVIGQWRRMITAASAQFIPGGLAVVGEGLAQKVPHAVVVAELLEATSGGKPPGVFRRASLKRDFDHTALAEPLNVIAATLLILREVYVMFDSRDRDHILGLTAAVLDAVRQ